MGRLCPHTHLRIGLITKEDALLLLTGLHARNATCIASCSVNSEGPIDVPPSLIELNCLPGILGRLADVLVAFDHDLPVRILGLLVRALHLLLLVHLPINLIFAEAER